ncbi:tetratricopeptide repeat protein [Hyphococcus sp.]|uniref:tetratricopeptide repeat protein n=1 Tax=Hyphococcus sp. TaxID=2038636 RepID=UPI0035C6D58B
MGENSRIRLFGRAGAAGLAVLFFSSASFAQEPEEAAREAVERDLYEPQRTSDREVRRQTQIPFEMVLSAPDNIQLNIDYARQQIAAGDLKEAGATLERILLLNPTLYDVRVLYGLVLYRLGLYDRARYELELALESGELPAALAAEAETYLGRIKYQQRRTRGALTITTGVDYESNRNQAPSSGQVLFSLPNPFNLNQFVTTTLDSNPKVDDFAFVVSAQGRVQHDLGTQEGSLLHADIGFYHSDKTEFDSLDLNAASVALGGTWYAGNWSVTPAVRGGFYWLDGEDYLATYGGEVEVAYRWTPKFTTYVNFRGEEEDFRDTSDFGAASIRSGRRLSGRAGFTWRFSSRQKLNVEGLYADKNGEAVFETYDRYGVFAQHSMLLGRGAFSMVGFWAENSSYDGPDPFITPAITRDEWLYRGRFTIGAPVSFFAPGLPEAIKDINLIAQYEYETVDSNILNFDYKTHKAAFLISKRIAF